MSVWDLIIEWGRGREGGRKEQKGREREKTVSSVLRCLRQEEKYVDRCTNVRHLWRTINRKKRKNKKKNLQSVRKRTCTHVRMQSGQRDDGRREKNLMKMYWVSLRTNKDVLSVIVAIYLCAWLDFSSLSSFIFVIDERCSETYSIRIAQLVRKIVINVFSNAIDAWEHFFPFFFSFIDKNKREKRNTFI